VVSDELRIAHRRQGVVDLQVKQVLDAVRPHVVERPAGCERRDRAAVTVWAEEQRVLRF
jgi:hypothetical protein